MVFLDEQVKLKTIPCALTIAGSDSGCGAGIQADLKTFAALGVHGTSVVTCVTAQNPRRVKGIEASSVRSVQNQLTAVFEELRPAAVKTGEPLAGSYSLKIRSIFWPESCQNFWSAGARAEAWRDSSMRMAMKVER